MAPPPDQSQQRASRRDLPRWMQLSRTAGFYRITPERRAAADHYDSNMRRATWNVEQAFRAYPPLYARGRFRANGPATRCPLWSGAYASAAVGAYQFLPATWRAATEPPWPSGFGTLPARIKAALDLVGAARRLGTIDRGVLCDRTLDNFRREMGLLPDGNGASA